jgi:predicted flap endonuclease-1-like 5' DNA nuclease
MKSEDIWLDNEVNELIWARGKFTIPSRVRVRATRFSDGVVEVTLPETSHEGSVRSENAERREKAAEKQILKAPTPEEGDDGHTHGADDRPVTDVKGVGPATAEKLEKAGFHTLQELAEADPAKVAEAAGASAEKAQGWIDDAKAIVAGNIKTADVKAQPQLEKAMDDESKADATKE